MPHAKSLRAIGQSLESLGIVAFVMEKNGRSYIVRSDQLPEIEKAKIKVSCRTGFGNLEPVEYARSLPAGRRFDPL